MNQFEIVKKLAVFSELRRQDWGIDLDLHYTDWVPPFQYDKIRDDLVGESGIVSPWKLDPLTSSIAQENNSSSLRLSGYQAIPERRSLEIARTPVSRILSKRSTNASV